MARGHAAHRARHPRGTIVCLAAVTLIMAAVPIGVIVDRQVRGGAAGVERVVCSNAPASGGPPASSSLLSRAAAAVSPSVVSVTAVSTEGTDDGSGIVLRSDGIVLTNNHVIADAAVNGGKITVTPSGGRATTAAVVGRDVGDDIAVLRAAGAPLLAPAPLGSATGLAVGEQVEAIGDALGNPGTVTAGIVSALGRTQCVDTPQPAQGDQQIYGVEPALPAQLTFKGLIQTDAALNPGDSGGALVDMAGKVVGVCTLLQSPTTGGGSVGVGFAIPIDQAYRDAVEIMQHAGLSL